MAENLAFKLYGKQSSKRKSKLWGARYETINSQWLTGLFREQGVLNADSMVENMALERFGEIGQMSGVYRMHLTYSGQRKGPDTLVIKTSLFEIKNRFFNKAFHVFEREIKTYQLPSPQSGLLRPKCWYSADQKMTGAAFLILDDLNDWRGLQPLKRVSVNDIERVLVALAEHQANWWNKQSLHELGFKTAPQKTKQEWTPMCQITWSKARTIFSTLMSDDLISMLDTYIENQDRVCKHLFEGSKTLCHGDLNANNLFFHDKDNKVCAVDWQTTYVGNWSEDLAYMLVMGLSQEDYSNNIDRLKSLYRSIMAEKNIEFDNLVFEREYAISILQSIAIMIVGVQLLNEEENPELYNFFLESIRNWAAAIPANMHDILHNSL